MFNPIPIEICYGFLRDGRRAQSVMTGGKSKNKARSVPATPEQHQEVDFEEEGEEVDTEDQQDEKASSSSLQ